MENCHSCVALSSSQPYPPQTTVHSLDQHGGWGQSLLHQLLPATDFCKRGFAPAFINCFHRQRGSLLGDQFAPPGGSCCPWPAKSSLYEARRVQHEECAVSHGLLNLQRGFSWQRSIAVLWKEENGTRASSPANCFINLESSNGLLNKALLFCFAIVLFWLPRKAPTLKASQSLYKCCLWF